MNTAQSSNTPTIWVLTDGKIGDDVQCLAVARALSPSFDKRVINPRTIFAAMAPWGPIDPRDRPQNNGSPIAPPFPQILIASGRRAIPYARTVKRAAAGATKVLLMKDPRISVAHADMVWAPDHDQLDGGNVITTLTSPHEMTAHIKAARENPAPSVMNLPQPMLGVVLGGPSGGARYDEAAISELSSKLSRAAEDFSSVAITRSRRTTDSMLQAAQRAVSGKPSFVWRGEGDNPYADILARADTLIVTADSHNMMSEALASGTGIYTFRPPGLAAKLCWFADRLEQDGLARPLDGAAAPFGISPVDATPEIVRLVKQRLIDTRD